MGRIWVKWDHFGVKNDGFPRGKTQEHGFCDGVTRWASSSSPWWVAQYRTPCFGCSGYSGVDPDFLKMILLMYLTVAMLSNPLETSNELDWTWFCESNRDFLKKVQERIISLNSFFSKEKGRVRLFTVIMIYKMVWNGIHEL